ncbi:TerC family protein [Nannocystis sp.]|uniref:TerC family protein n=1 Tax=Nannocystis sp. TaxID=1962667 RepID=UPI0025CE6C3A|nr:TerC family protein [Nannocystis sp.]
MDPELLQHLANPDVWISLLTLSVLEVVLGLDNVIFISILVGKLPADKRDRARRIGLIGAFVMRIGLLSALSWVMGLKHPLFTVLGQEITGKEAVLLGGGLFLLYKATKEIHERVDGPLSEDEIAKVKATSVASVVFQILLLDLVFSIDSVVTAVGMAQHLWIMIAANVIALLVMLRAAKSIAEFVDRHPTVKILALSFLMMIGLLLVAEAFEVHVPRGYVYFAMAYSVCVELINIRIASKRAAHKAAAA